MSKWMARGTILPEEEEEFPLVVVPVFDSCPRANKKKEADDDDDDDDGDGDDDEE